MDARRYQRLKDLLSRALDLDESERPGFVDTACDGDEEMRRELEILVAEVDADSPMESGAPPDEPEPLPRSFGAYRILGKLGEGGMGLVYLAEQVTPVRRRVALKVIRLGMDSKEAIARFEAERQALAMMNHPNIAAVHEAGVTPEGRLYFAMELVEGVPITHYCDGHGLSPAARLRLFVRVCQGIEHAHRRGVIHRDIKPSNVLVRDQDGEPLAKIIDFGLARATDQRLTEKTLCTRQGGIIGTPSYMSPEQASSGREVDRRTDVYSLGVLLYELLVGELPLELDLHSIAFDEFVRRIREQEPVTPSTRWTRLNRARTTHLASKRSTSTSGLLHELRGDLDWICMKAIDKEPERRYRTVAAFAADVERYLASEPVVARPPSAVYRIRKFAHKNRGPVAAVFAVAVALVAGSAASLFFALRAGEKAREARDNLDLAQENERDARSRLQEVLRLSDLRNLEKYSAEADHLWPASSANLGRIEAWLGKARSLSANLASHRATLARLRARGVSRVGTDENDGPPAETWEFADPRDEWWHGTLERLVARLEAFSDTIDDVERRWRFARTVREKTVRGEEASRRWEEARRSIHDCKAYDGLELAPQEGLVPIGRDGRSGLWEFAHLQTGTEPERDEDGTLRLAEETGLILVLLPGGTFRMGADPGIDPHAEADEAPAHDVTLEPFFLSKYEMTQGQWLRATANDPSIYGPDREALGRRHSLLHPVENVSWQECDETLSRLDLALPTEAQWEYACRAGTSSVWWTGNSRDSLAGKANLADQAAWRFGLRWEAIKDWPALDDGYALHAPAGAYDANPFGLHEVHGNVWEWCRDFYGAYDLPFEPGDGERLVPPAIARDRVIRGGSFSNPARYCRSANRFQNSPSIRYLGVRPARRLR